MDLISRKALLDEIDKHCKKEGSCPGQVLRVTSTQFTAKKLFYMIHEQPIAYDPEKVIEKLQRKYEEASILAKHASTLEHRENYVGKMDAYKEAMNIVRGGGIGD